MCIFIGDWWYVWWWRWCYFDIVINRRWRPFLLSCSAIPRWLTSPPDRISSRIRWSTVRPSSIWWPRRPDRWAGWRRGIWDRPSVPTCRPRIASQWSNCKFERIVPWDRGIGCKSFWFALNFRAVRLRIYLDSSRPSSQAHRRTSSWRWNRS